MDCIRLGALAGISVALVFSLMWTSAVVVDGNWRLGEETLSELGGDRPGAIYFNSGVVFAGVASLVFWLGLRCTVSKTILSRMGTLALFASSVALIGVGVFPIDTGDPHTVASYLFFSLMLMAFLLLTIPFRDSPVFGKGYAIMSLAMAVVSLGVLLLISLELAEAVAVASMLLWVLILSAKMLLFIH